MITSDRMILVISFVSAQFSFPVDIPSVISNVYVTPNIPCTVPVHLQVKRIISLSQVCALIISNDVQIRFQRENLKITKKLKD